MQRQKNQIRKLEFERNENSKMLCQNFICVAPPVKFDKLGERVQIRIAGKHFCFAEVIMQRQMLFEDIIKAGYNYLDTGLDEKEYFNYLRTKFESRRWREGIFTLYDVVLFKKIVQLNLFDDNEQFDSKG